jgi:hypothetical protein
MADKTLLDEWTAALLAELGVDLEVDVDGVLDLAGVAAHSVARPAAPLTTFLVGYAAALRGGGAETVRELSEVAAALARRRAAQPPTGQSPIGPTG